MRKNKPKMKILKKISHAYRLKRIAFAYLKSAILFQMGSPQLIRRIHLYIFVTNPFGSIDGLIILQRIRV